MGRGREEIKRGHDRRGKEKVKERRAYFVLGTANS